MENIGMGAGLAAIAFWGFVACCVIGGIWDGVRKREAQHETLRRVIESGQPVDDALMDRLLSINSLPMADLKAGLKVSGQIMIFIAPGMAIMGIVIGMQAEQALLPLLGVSALIGFIAAGLLVAAKGIEVEPEAAKGSVSFDSKA